MQVDQTRDHARGGLGIGLTLVKRLVEMHGGSVAARSDGPGMGSSFVVRLPIESLRPDPAGLGSRPGTEHRATRRRFLVVDDNLDSCSSLAILLSLEGHEVETARDGLEALALAEAWLPDVVILDIGLPRMDGFMVAHAIRVRFANQRNRPRLIALTGHASEEDRGAALRSGFDGHLSKPVEPRQLLRMIADEGSRQVTPSELG